MTEFVCRECGAAYPQKGLPHRCLQCGGVYTFRDLQYDSSSRTNEIGFWRFRDLIGIGQNPSCYLGEGETPLVFREIAGMKLHCKLESLNPSGAFKDRNSAISMSFIRQRGIEQIVEDSSGNAGASLAMYAAAYGVESGIYVPESTSGPKMKQIKDFGARIMPVSGPRENANKAVIKAVEEGRAAYASHALLPFGMAAYATIAFEIYEQLGRLPDRVFCPIGHGSLFYGVLKGFEAVSNFLGAVPRPKMIGAQPERCSPLVSSWNGSPFVPSGQGSVAEGTVIENPVRGKEILSDLKHGWDDLCAISEDQIINAYKLTSRSGIYVEPTSAMAFAGVLKLGKKASEIDVIIFTGSGLKSSM